MSRLQRNTAGVRACLLILAAMFALSPLLASAQESKPAGNVASVWYMWVKADKAEQFQKAIREHGAWRKQAGEGFYWRVYQPVAGDDLAHYVVHSGGHAWADFDSNLKWEIDKKSSDAFNRNVGPYIERFSHYFTQDEQDISYWPSEEAFPLVSVTLFKLGPGRYGDFRSAVSKARTAAEAQKFGGHWSLSSITGGDDDMALIIPHRNYADMAGPSPSFMEMMAKHMGGQDKAVKGMQAIQSTIESGDTTVYVLRRDLSTPVD